MKAATHNGRCICADQCSGGSRDVHVHNLDEFMGKLSRMLAAPDPHDVQHSLSVWHKVWLGPSGFVVLGKFWDDFYVAEEVGSYMHNFLGDDHTPSGTSFDLRIDAPRLLSQYREQRTCNQWSSVPNDEL
jgi:hypothetical protein